MELSNSSSNATNESGGGQKGNSATTSGFDRIANAANATPAEPSSSISSKLKDATSDGHGASSTPFNSRSEYSPPESSREGKSKDTTPSNHGHLLVSDIGVLIRLRRLLGYIWTSFADPNVQGSPSNNASLPQQPELSTSANASSHHGLPLPHRPARQTSNALASSASTNARISKRKASASSPLPSPNVTATANGKPRIPIPVPTARLNTSTVSMALYKQVVEQNKWLAARNAELEAENKRLGSVVGGLRDRVLGMKLERLGVGIG